MVTAEILNSHPVSTLKKEISKTNIKGYSKMKKPEIVALMLKNKERFSHIKHSGKTTKAKAPAKEPEKKKKIPFKIKEKKPATPKPATPKAKTPTPKAKTPPKASPTPKSPKAPTPKSASPKLSNEEKVEREIFYDDTYEDWKYHQLQWDESYQDQAFRILIAPAQDPQKELPAYKKEFTQKSYIKEQEDDHTADNLMDIAHGLLFSFDSYKEFLTDFQKKMPEYFKYFIQYYRKEAKVPIGNEKAIPTKAPTAEEEREKLKDMLLDEIKEGSEQRKQIEYGRSATRYGYLSDITAIKDKAKDSAKTKVLNIWRKHLKEKHPDKKPHFTGFKKLKLEAIIRKALNAGVNPSSIYRIWDNHKHFQGRTDF